MSDNSPKDWVYKRFPASFEEVGIVHNKVEAADDGQEVPKSHEKANIMTTTVGGKVSDNSPEDWVYKRFPASFKEVGRVHNKVKGTTDVFSDAVHNGAVHHSTQYSS